MAIKDAYIYMKSNNLLHSSDEDLQMRLDKAYDLFVNEDRFQNVSFDTGEIYNELNSELLEDEEIWEWSKVALYFTTHSHLGDTPIPDDYLLIGFDDGIDEWAHIEVTIEQALIIFKLCDEVSDDYVSKLLS